MNRSPGRNPSTELARVVAETRASDIRDAVLAALDDEVLQVLTVPKTICSMVCSSAIVAIAGTTRHRQISGLIPATTARSRYTADNSPTARTDSGIKVTRNLGDESKPTVKFWAMPEVSLVAAWASTAAVLLGVGVSRS